MFMTVSHVRPARYGTVTCTRSFCFDDFPDATKTIMYTCMRRIALINCGRVRLSLPGSSSFCSDSLARQQSSRTLRECIWHRQPHVKQSVLSFSSPYGSGFSWRDLVYANRQFRWKHNRAARRGNHLEKLDDLAHSTRRQDAAERKNKKRDKSRGDSSDAEEGTAKVDALKSHGGDSSSVEPRLPDVTTVRKEMEQHYQRFVEALKGIRGAEPTPELFDRIMVNAYGSQVPLSTVAQVVIVNPTLATATCFDPSLAKSVAVAIRDKLDLNAAVDEDDSVRIHVPRPSLESRRSLSHQVHERGEACRKHVRNVRRSAMDIIKQGMVGKLEGISKDDAFRASQTLDSVTDEIVKKVTATEKEKQQSIMEV